MFDSTYKILGRSVDIWGCTICRAYLPYVFRLCHTCSGKVTYLNSNIWRHTLVSFHSFFSLSNISRFLLAMSLGYTVNKHDSHCTRTSRKVFFFLGLTSPLLPKFYPVFPVFSFWPWFMCPKFLTFSVATSQCLLVISVLLHCYPGLCKWHLSWVSIWFTVRTKTLLQKK